MEDAASMPTTTTTTTTTVTLLLSGSELLGKPMSEVLE